MSVGINTFFLVVATRGLVLGMLGNGLIGLVNCIEWAKSWKVSSADFILTSLGMVRIIQLYLILFDSLIMVLSPHLYTICKLVKLFTILWALINHLSIWFATCLSIFYLLKIANFSHFFFTWLNWRMNRVVLVLFLGSLFLSFIYLFICEKNMTLHSDISKVVYLQGLRLLSLTYIIPFLLTLTSLLLLFISLVRHTKNLQLNSLGSRVSSTEAHKRAMKMVIVFLLLFIINFISTLIGDWIFLEIENYQVMMFIMMILVVFPSGHSFIIILGNNKLRQSSLRLPWHLKFSLKKAKPLTS
uniref:Taste receptor type 2 n=1 Tax=Nomascus leucogenys TaxID=61853 RepID=A0A2I3HYS2_NOMLE